MDVEPDMTDHTAGAGPDDPGITGLIGDVRRLIDDARTFAEAELAYQKSRASVTAAAAKSILLYGIVAAVLAVFGLGALTVGLLLALTPLVTAWGATAIVAGTLFLIAFICMKLAGARLKRTKSAVLPDEAG